MKYDQEGFVIRGKMERTKPRIGVWETRKEDSQKTKNEKRPKYPKQDIMKEFIK